MTLFYFDKDVGYKADENCSFQSYSFFFIILFILSIVYLSKIHFNPKQLTLTIPFVLTQFPQTPFNPIVAPWRSPDLIFMFN